MEPRKKLNCTKISKFFEIINRNSLKRSKVFQKTIQNKRRNLFKQIWALRFKSLVIDYYLARNHNIIMVKDSSDQSSPSELDRRPVPLPPFVP